MSENKTGAAHMPSMHNKAFVRMVTSIRRILPMLATIILIGVYVVSAIITGQLLSKLMTSAVTGALWLGLAIGFGIQLTRCALVFFPQLNPNRPVFGFWGEAIAFGMFIISVGSVISLVSANNLHVAVTFELSVLMAAGMGVEIFLLREVRFYTEMELFRNQAWWKELQDHFLGRRDFKRFMDRIRDESDAETMIGNPGAQTPLPDRRGMYRRFRAFPRTGEAPNEHGTAGGSSVPLDPDPALLNLAGS